jgi:hypothetical protein
MSQCTTTPVVETPWLDAVVLADQLRRGHPLPRLDSPGLSPGERASLEAEAGYAQWRGASQEPTRAEVSRLVVTDRRILVDHPGRGLVTLRHVDLENLQLARTGPQWHLDLLPVGINPRVRLTGGAAPLIAVHVAHTVFPATWARLSGLLPLLDAAA